MADGKEPRKHNAAYQNTISAQAYENAMDDWVLQTAVNRQATKLLNEQRKDNFNFQEEQFNFQMDEQIRAYEHSKNIFDRNSEAVDMEVQYQKDQIYSNADARLQELSYQQDDLDSQFARDSINNAFQAGNLALGLKINEQERVARENDFASSMQQQTNQLTQAQAQGRVDFLKASLAKDAAAGESKASGRRGRTARTQTNAIKTAASIDQAALMDQLIRGQGSFKDVTTSLVATKKTGDKIGSLQRDKIENDQQQQAALFGLTVEQYTADTEKLGRMMLDTYAGIDSQLDRLAQQEFQTRTELYSKMPLPPRMPPRAKPPREIPYEKYAKPTPAPFMDKNTMATTPQPKKQSGFGTFLSIAGSLVGLGATVLTGGAAAGVFGAGAAAWGGGLAAGGSILRGLGGVL